jgi:hypothetical protein
MSPVTILFRIPFTIYWLCWDKDRKKFLFAIKRFSGGLEPPYYWDFFD